MSDQVAPSEDQSKGLIKSTQEFGAGLFLMAVAAFAYWQGLDLPRGSLRAMGPGMLPMALTFMVGAGGFLMVLYSFFEAGPRLERWSLRGPFFIFGHYRFRSSHPHMRFDGGGTCLDDFRHACE